MRSTTRLFAVVARGSALATLLYSGIAFLLSALLGRPGVPHAVQGIGLSVTVLVPSSLAALWVFRKLLLEYPRREACAAAITFGIFTPVPLAIGLLLGPIIGGLTGDLLRTESRMVAFSGAIVGIVVIVTLATFVTSWAAARITQRIDGSQTH